MDQKITEHALNILDCIQKVGLQEITWHVEKNHYEVIAQKTFSLKKS